MCSKQKSLNFGHYVPNDKVLNKKVPENPKYKNVKPAIDTGKNVRKQIDDLREKQKNCVSKKDEVFRRIRCVRFIQLAKSFAEELLRDGNEMGNEPNVTDLPRSSEALGRRCMTNVLMGIGELDALNDKKKIRSSPVKQNRQMPYLLLDVRDRDDFLRCHIITAKHYPYTMLSRSIGYETDDMKLIKNVPHLLIILYDDDESIAPRVATTLVERGYENIYLLTGGLKLAFEICPQGLTTSSQMISPVHMLSHNAASQPHKSEKDYFTQEDLEAINHYLGLSNRENNSVWSCSSAQSVKSKSVGSYHQSNCDALSTSSRSSTLSRRFNLCSSSMPEQRPQQSAASSISSRTSHTLSNSTKTAESNHLRTAINGQAKSKKAPWK